MLLTFTLSSRTDDHASLELELRNPAMEDMFKLAEKSIKEGHFRDVWIELEDGTRFYLSLNPVPNVAHDAMADHE